MRTLIDAGTLTAIGGALAAVLGGVAKLVAAMRARRTRCPCPCDCCHDPDPELAPGVRG